MPKERKTEKTTFTNSEVGTLVEGLSSKFDIVAEEVRGLSDRMGAMEADVHELKTDMKFVKNAIRVAIPTINRRLDNLEAKVGA